MAEDVKVPDARSALLAIDKRLIELWREGAWFVAGWTLDKEDLVVAVAPIADLPQLAESEPALLRGDPLDAKALVKVAPARAPAHRFDSPPATGGRRRR